MVGLYLQDSHLQVDDDSSHENNHTLIYGADLVLSNSN
ncbi:hypothetical protein ADIMK_4070 [Marinobacterium lacunae]|uniref:Uncharacterized protein n=1 Tax=Marinobacterium lacunae TaxID=1232683 RepID=A0A081FTR8_9GAMM|nr:hypothetical protein ADIMK_4070 [Marinobacterium lacunae]